MGGAQQIFPHLICNRFRGASGVGFTPVCMGKCPRVLHQWPQLVSLGIPQHHAHIWFAFLWLKCKTETILPKLNILMAQKANLFQWQNSESVFCFWCAEPEKSFSMQQSSTSMWDWCRGSFSGSYLSVSGTGLDGQPPGYWQGRGALCTTALSCSVAFPAVRSTVFASEPSCSDYGSFWSTFAGWGVFQLSLNHCKLTTGYWSSMVIGGIPKPSQGLLQASV